MPNWENESAEDLGRIKVFSGRLEGRWGHVRDAIFEGSDYLGGIPFGKMHALEAASIQDKDTGCTGSFASLLHRPSLKLLQMRIPSYASIDLDCVIDRLSKDVAGERIEQLETLILTRSWRWPDDFEKYLLKLLAFFPNLKSLRVCALTKRVSDFSLELGRMLNTNLIHLSELVIEDEVYIETADFNANVQLILCGLGSEWALASAGCRKRTARFVAEGRDRAQLSSYFFEDKFFQ